jgi:sugar/nucleoside kinase (ribokinase family)
MEHLATLEAVDYLVIGHLTCDLTPDGPRLGGGAAYAALTARAMGLRAGVLTAWGHEIPLSELEGIPMVVLEADHSTTFENVYTPEGRAQTIRHVAPGIDYAAVPEAWRRSPILHLAPVAQEVDPSPPATMHPALLGLSAQGWLRRWDEKGRVSAVHWPFAQDEDEALQRAGAVFISAEDVGGDEHQIEELMLASRLLLVTEGAAGARLYWNRDLRRFRAPQVAEVDATGAGDIFAAAFLARLYATRDPWEAARFACRMSAISVMRPGVQGVPTQSEIQACLTEVVS